MLKNPEYIIEGLGVGLFTCGVASALGDFVLHAVGAANTLRFVDLGLEAAGSGLAILAVGGICESLHTRHINKKH